MVYGVLAVLFFTVLQGGMIIHTRNALIDAASAGARYGALADRTVGDGVGRARDVLGSTVPGQGGADITGTTISEGGGVPVVRVTIRTQLPALGFLPGPIPLEVHGHAYRY